MDRDTGWVELLQGTDPTVLGRGRAILTYAPTSDDEPPAGQRGQLAPVAGVWHGRLDPLQLAAGIDELVPDRYRIRFEANGEILLVVVDAYETLDERTGYAQIHSADDQVPSVLLEVGGE